MNIAAPSATSATPPTTTSPTAASLPTPATTEELVAAASHRLTPTDRRIAEAVLAESTLLAFGTVSDLASRVGTSRPSIVRFANKLGFSGYTELQEHVRRSLSQRLSRPSQRIRQENEPAKSAIDSAIRSVFAAIEGPRLAALAAPIVAADTVWILSGETSRAAGHVLYSGLSMVRPGVRFLRDYSLGTDLSTAEAGQVAVVLDFSRYRRQVITAARILAATGVEVVAITDSPLSPLVELTETWCEIEVPAIGPFDSSVSAVTLAELLVSQVAKDLRDDATARIDRIEELWEKTGTFEPA